MATKIARFTATKTVTKPVKVRFRTKSGKTVSFKALRTFRKKEVVRFPVKNK